MSDARSLIALIPRLRRYARALAGDRIAADDLVQDTLERAWSKFHLYRRGTDLRAWLFTVMHNVYVNQLRALRPTTPLDEDMPELAQPVRETDTLVLRDLDAAIRRLPPDQREVLLLVALEEMSYDEAAGALGVPIGTVMSRLARAREKLRAMLSGLPPRGRQAVEDREMKRWIRTTRRRTTAEMKAISQGLHQLYDPVLDEPVPECLRARIARRASLAHCGGHRGGLGGGRRSRRA